ncbi:MAG: nitroreductase family deazaflavin-dependent oxidoreductase [bacterium]|nr:nitroreductase family deazaflavin-dependent oxidoreductase [bacterium]
MAGPDPLRRFVHRLPLHLAPLGIDRLVARLTGVPWIVLETVGRRTGRRHTVVLDVLHHDPGRDVYYVQPAYGARADWVQNALHTSDVTARVGGRHVHARARDATGAEGAEATLRLVRAHPWYARVVAFLVGHVHGLERSDDALRPELARLCTVALDVVPDAPV